MPKYGYVLFAVIFVLIIWGAFQLGWVLGADHESAKWSDLIFQLTEAQKHPQKP